VSEQSGRPYDAWCELVRRFADGRQPCNCGEAYRDKDGTCAHGCSSNLITAKYEIARRVLAGEKP
jgi:hypothetical protein